MRAVGNNFKSAHKYFQHFTKWFGILLLNQNREKNRKTETKLEKELTRRSPVAYRPSPPGTASHLPPHTRRTGARGCGALARASLAPACCRGPGRLHECHATSPTPSHFSLALWTSPSPALSTERSRTADVTTATVLPSTPHLVCKLRHRPLLRPTLAPSAGTACIAGCSIFFLLGRRRPRPSIRRRLRVPELADLLVRLAVSH